METVTKKCNRLVTRQELERIDQTISFVLESAWKYIEGIRRNVPYSAKKIKLRAKKQFYLGMLRKREGRRIDKYALKKKQEMVEIEVKE